MMVHGKELNKARKIYKLQRRGISIRSAFMPINISRAAVENAIK